MCGKRLKAFLLSLVLFSVPLSQYGYTDVSLTDEEAQELTDLIKTSQEDLRLLRTDLNNAQTELNNALRGSEELKTYYERQLKEAKRDKYIMLTVTVLSIFTAGYFAVK